MAPWLADGSFRAWRRSDYHCSICNRVFERTQIPIPDHNGKRTCRDCRVKLYGAENYQRKAES